MTGAPLPNGCSYRKEAHVQEGKRKWFSQPSRSVECSEECGGKSDPVALWPNEKLVQGSRMRQATNEKLVQGSRMRQARVRSNDHRPCMPGDLEGSFARMFSPLLLPSQHIIAFHPQAASGGPRRPQAAPAHYCLSPPGGPAPCGCIVAVLWLYCGPAPCGCIVAVLWLYRGCRHSNN